MHTTQAKTIKIVHYNIKELDSHKIMHNDPQLAYVKKILDQKNFDLLSLNEVQYDMRGVPTKKFKTTGRNLEKIRKLLNLKHLKYESFHPANTGENAQTKPDGTYYISPNSDEARANADQVNFGVMPAQYSTGALSNLKVFKELIIKDLKWKDFNPAADFKPYQTADGQKFPDNMKLFDKNFSDIVYELDGKRFHIILLHTVPSYGFGNPSSINIYRNAEQLKFLEWYLTGNTDFNVPLKKIKPLNKTDRFIAMGDFNVSVKAENSPGADVLKRLFKKINTWIPQDKMTFTNESSHFGPAPAQFLLDYIITSKNIKTVQGEIMLPEISRTELGCEENISKLKENDFVQVEYKKDDQVCYAKINREYYHYKMASDHFPLYGEFEL